MTQRQRDRETHRDRERECVCMCVCVCVGRGGIGYGAVVLKLCYKLVEISGWSWFSLLGLVFSASVFIRILNNSACLFFFFPSSLCFVLLSLFLCLENTRRPYYLCLLSLSPTLPVSSAQYEPTLHRIGVHLWTYLLFLFIFIFLSIS